MLGLTCNVAGEQSSTGTCEREKTMTGGTKPRVGTKRAEKFKDGLKKSGGIKTQRPAGPSRSSKTPPTGTKGSQLQKRTQP